MIADVITEKRTGADRGVYSYLVPGDLVGQIKVGAIVGVPFGRHQVRAVVKEIKDNETKSEYELKPIKSIELVFALPPEYLLVVDWISEYYLCSLGEALNLFLPPKMIRPRRQTATKRPEVKDLNKLTSAQQKIFGEIRADWQNGSLKPVLLHGATASGKTEIYLHLTKAVLDVGKQVIVLVPEIVLTPQTINRFEAVFGGQVALIHSGLSKSERLKNSVDFWQGQKNILIGPRSALLVPSQKLGLIIVDEEGESAYKQEKNPKYHAVKLAEQITAKTNSLMLLGSATPTVESYYRSKRGEINLFQLPDRFSQKLPPTEIIDLRAEIRGGNYSPISDRLRQAIEGILADQRQVFLFLNRRGAATFVSCRECGNVILCPECSVPLVYHLDNKSNYLSCHHCDLRTAVPGQCPACQGYKIKYFGAGVEKIEQEINNLFPKARIRRVDSQSMANKDEYQKLDAALRQGEIDILIGTQIIAKGWDVPNVDLVGIISADVGLHLPYYKADERIFQLLMQVAGRSGRGERPGRTILQTYWPEAKSVQAAAVHDYNQFYRAEIENRKGFNYPPFTHLVRVVAEDKDVKKAKSIIAAVVRDLDERKIEYLGPAKPFLSKLRGNYRYHLIIKIPTLPDPRLRAIFCQHPYLYWDVDPEELL